MNILAIGEENMFFINRESEREIFKNHYERAIQNNKNQVYIIEANHGIGKSEFIREVLKDFSYPLLEIFRSDEDDELSTFRRMVLELDKTSVEYRYDDFKTFYRKKANNTKAIQILLKITAIFGQALAKNKGFDIELTSLIDNPIQSEKFILDAQIENLFEYSTYVLTTVHLHIVFQHAFSIDSGSLDLLSKLIGNTKGSVFIFESNNDENSSKIERYLQNNRNIILERYQLGKLSDDCIEKYIQQLSSDLKLESAHLDLSILEKSIEKGNLTEILSILKDFSDRLQKDTSTKMRSTKEILQNLSDKQKILLVLIGYANGKLNCTELGGILEKLGTPLSESDIKLKLDEKIVEQNKDYISLTPFAYEIFNIKDYMQLFKYVVASALIQDLNLKLKQNYNNRYVDVLVEYYLNNKQFNQLKSLSSQIGQRLRKFNMQAERIDYFQKFHAIRHELCEISKEFSIIFAKIAYDANLYCESRDFIELSNNEDDDTVFIQALVLNRCEDFIGSKDYISSKLEELDKQSSIYFNLSLVLMMNLIQLNKRATAASIFNDLKSYTQERLYPYLVRLSNVFYSDFKERLKVVESVTKDFYNAKDEFSGLHAIYLAYLYALTGQPEQAEKSLLEARGFFGNNLIYNHMILHNEATIKFHTCKIDEDIPALLNNAKITAYDEYDRFAINNNLLVYYIIRKDISKLECQEIVMELEEMLKRTKFKRFVDKIYYNLYHYYINMFNYEKSECYKTKLSQENLKSDDTYKYKLLYETSWKLPINIKYPDK